MGNQCTCADHCITQGDPNEFNTMEATVDTTNQNPFEKIDINNN